jgi:hypothetical protein
MPFLRQKEPLSHLSYHQYLYEVESCSFCTVILQTQLTSPNVDGSDTFVALRIPVVGRKHRDGGVEDGAIALFRKEQ